MYKVLLADDEGIVIDENLLMDDVCEFIEKLELIILHKSYNSSRRCGPSYGHSTAQAVYDARQ